MGVGARGTGVGARDTRCATGVNPTGTPGTVSGPFTSSFAEAAGAAGTGATGATATGTAATGVAVGGVGAADGTGGSGRRDGGLGGLGRADGRPGGAPTTGGGPGISTAGSSSRVGSAPGGFDGGRGGMGRLRFAAGGTDIGFCRCGGGGGKLRAGSDVTTGDAGVADALGSDFAPSGRGMRDGADGGIEPRGRGGAGFFDELSSSAMLDRAYTKPEMRKPHAWARKAWRTRRTPPPAPCMLCGGAR
jgi:hypothetical protein